MKPEGMTSGNSVSGTSRAAPQAKVANTALEHSHHSNGAAASAMKFGDKECDWQRVDAPLSRHSYFAKNKDRRVSLQSTCISSMDESESYADGNSGTLLSGVVANRTQQTKNRYGKRGIEHMYGYDGMNGNAKRFREQ